MKFATILGALAALAAASPVPNTEETTVLDLNLANGPAATANDVINGVCKPLTFIFARGTTEPGNLGFLVGPAIVTALQAKYPGQVAVQGVKYPASIPGYLAHGDKKGGVLEAQLANEAIQKCPNTKIILSGYSQGGYLVHHAAQLLNPQTTAATMAVIFGDPLYKNAVGQIPASRTLIICHPGDDICGQGIVIKPEHLTYGEDAGEVVSFVGKVLDGWGDNLGGS